MEGLGSGAGTEGAPAAVVEAAQAAYVQAIGAGMIVGAAAVLLAAVVAWKLIARRRPAVPSGRTAPEHAVEAEAALAAPAAGGR